MQHQYKGLDAIWELFTFVWNVWRLDDLWDQTVRIWKTSTFHTLMDPSNSTGVPLVPARRLSDAVLDGESLKQLIEEAKAEAEANSVISHRAITDHALRPTSASAVSVASATGSTASGGYDTEVIPGPVLLSSCELGNFSPPDLERVVDEFFQEVRKLERSAWNDKHPVLVELKSKISELRRITPAIVQLGHPSLQERHWRSIFEAVKHAWVGVNFTLEDLFDFGVLDEEHADAVDGVCSAANKEWSFEKMLDKMENEWREIEIPVKEYKDTIALSSIDELQALLDEHLVKTQTMKGSPFVKPFAERVINWETLLVSLQDTLDEWTKVQATFLYLEPIFVSEDIRQQMPQEADRFDIVQRVWRDVANIVRQNTLAMQIAAMPEVHTKLLQQNSLLDQVQAGLAAYLEEKRLYFPRFFFLTNDEMLEILSKTSDPTRVQPFLKSCFEGIAELDFLGDDYCIKSMRSAAQEQILFNQDGSEPILPGAAVEKWLLQVEKQMRESVFYCARNAIAAYPGVESQAPVQDRVEWVLSWPEQVVLVVSQLFWTSETESALRSQGQSGIIHYLERCQAQLNDIVRLVRGDLSKLARNTCGALVVLDVHARDVLTSIKDSVQSVEDFDWVAQLRYYWDPQQRNSLKLPGLLVANMIRASEEYGYEYLGNTSRLVITPLTDRCYRTLMSAIQLNLGGAPEGPAGTGKTETTKDLAKAIAMQCMVFNCSDGLDYLAIGKFFKGLIGSGAWVCFDEFNRIELEVLSVVAQQILTIQRSKIRRDPRILFEGTELELKMTCNVFITMNPGYAGRSELPDNLKVAPFLSISFFIFFLFFLFFSLSDFI